jgi:transcriptional regulator with XRE-family HTH domain
MPKTHDTAHPVDLYVGARVRFRRKQVDMSQEKLANALGLTFQQVQKYERGANRISCSKLVEMAKAMSVPPGWFFEGMPDFIAGDAPLPVGEENAVELAVWAVSADGYDWLLAGQRLPPKVRERVRVLALEISASSQGPTESTPHLRKVHG